MLDKPTNELDEMLSDMKPERLEDFYKENGEYMADGDRPFYNYMKSVLREKGIRHKDLYIRADMTESYGQQILSMDKHTKNRDLILSLCLAGHFSIIETNRSLKLYGITDLYAKDKRDVCIMAAINARKFELSDVDELLEEHGFEKLKRNTNEE